MTGFLTLPAKCNEDGSYSVSIRVSHLLHLAFVPFYRDGPDGGTGYQRFESGRNRRGTLVDEYIGQCFIRGAKPRLFELTGNIRNSEAEFIPLCDEHRSIGTLKVKKREKTLSVIDGGTRLLGIEKALAHGFLNDNHQIDVRVFLDLREAQEIGQFLLINERQKKARTDLGIRVLQTRLDGNKLSQEDRDELSTVIDKNNRWRYSASTIAGNLNSSDDSPWYRLIQMPNDDVTRPIKLQGFITSLKPILTNDDLRSRLNRLYSSDNLKQEPDAFIETVIERFWSAVKQVNPHAALEPSTSVLWGAIGATSLNMALAEMFVTMLRSRPPSLQVRDFKSLLEETDVADYDFWFSKAPAGSDDDEYPSEKGVAAGMIGAANHKRLGLQIIDQMRSKYDSLDDDSYVVE